MEMFPQPELGSVRDYVQSAVLELVGQSSSTSACAAGSYAGTSGPGLATCPQSMRLEELHYAVCGLIAIITTR